LDQRGATVHFKGVVFAASKASLSDAGAAGMAMPDTKKRGALRQVCRIQKMEISLD